MQESLPKQSVDDSFIDMLHFFASGALGTYNYRPENVNVDKILCFARQQGVVEIVFQAVEKLGCYKIAPEETRRFLTNTWWNLRRLNHMDGVYKDLERDGISFCVLKGESLSNLYANPYLRISSDTDIYIHEDDMDRMRIVFKNHGFEFLSLQPYSHHHICCRGSCGRVEIHTNITNGFSREGISGSNLFHAEKFIFLDNLRGGRIPVLGVTDNLIFIFFHFIKHFAKRGAGIRQIADIVLYVKRHREDIDMERFYRILDMYDHRKLFDYLLAFGIEYFGMTADDLCYCSYDKRVLEHILADIYSGGIFGREDIWRNCFLGLVNNGGIRDLRQFVNKVIPSSSIIKLRFSYVEKFPFLYPMGILHRGIGFSLLFIWSLIFHGDKIKKRRQLIRELDLN